MKLKMQPKKRTPLGVTLPLTRVERERQVLTKAFEKWGTAIVDHLYGAFAFSVYDDAADKLYCFRDQVGQKQMFYTVADGEFLCSGDIPEHVFVVSLQPPGEKRPHGFQRHRRPPPFCIVSHKV